MTPLIATHVAFATAALLFGPVALTARKGSPRHRWAGRLWVALMLGAAITSVFIRDFSLPNLAGYTPIHLLTLATFAGLGGGVWAIVHRNVRRHKITMWSTYVGGCVVAGLFTLLPNRILGQALWHHALGWI